MASCLATSNVGRPEHGQTNDHTRHKLDIHDLDAHLDVLAFEGEEQLSQPFKYIIEFTCIEQGIAAAQVLGKFADFTLHNPPVKLAWGTPEPELPLRTVRGIITDFKRLSSSRDEARYEVILQHQLALLGKGKQYRIYLQQSVPEIVKSVLCMAPRFDLNDELDIPEAVAKSYWRAGQLREWGWEQIMNGRCEAFPPTELSL